MERETKPNIQMHEQRIRERHWKVHTTPAAGPPRSMRSMRSMHVDLFPSHSFARNE
jgi:hypothetical protein